MVFKTTCIDVEKALREDAFSSQKQHFFLRRIRGILAMRRRACSVTSESSIGELGVRHLSTINSGQDSRQQSHEAVLYELVKAI